MIFYNLWGSGHHIRDKTCALDGLFIRLLAKIMSWSGLTLGGSTGRFNTLLCPVYGHFFTP